MSRINIGNGELFVDGKKMADVESGFIEFIDPVVVKDSEMEEYKEREILAKERQRKGEKK